MAIAFSIDLLLGSFTFHCAIDTYETTITIWTAINWQFWGKGCGWSSARKVKVRWRVDLGNQWNIRHAYTHYVDRLESWALSIDLKKNCLRRHWLRRNLLRLRLVSVAGKHESKIKLHSEMQNYNWIIYLLHGVGWRDENVDGCQWPVHSPDNTPTRNDHENSSKSYTTSSVLHYLRVHWWGSRGELRNTRNKKESSAALSYPWTISSSSSLDKRQERRNVAMQGHL